MRRYLLFVLFLCLHWAARGQSGYEYRYWFDGDDSRQHTGTSEAAQWHIDADLSELACSWHSFHLQVKDAEGVWSAPVTRYFVKSSAGSVITYHYWMDGNAAGVVSGPFSGEPMTVDVTGVEDGFHVMYFQVEGKGSSSVPATAMFIKVPQTEGEGVDHLTCVCSIDGKPYRQERVPASGGIVKWDLDVASLPQGLHRMQVQAVTPSGAATNVSEHFFFRATTAAELADMKLLYTVDGDNYFSQAGRVSNGLYHFDVDVAALEDGLHRLTYMMASSTGTTTRVSTAFFMKTPVGGPGIRSYKYWLNDNEDGAHHVELEKRADPFSLISLLPVESCPIRSSCFHFEVENGQPVVYAKNDIHFQFYDVSGRVAEASRQYVDYGVGRPVEDIVPLESDVRHTADKPEENAISWYRMTAVTGDSLSLRADQACTLRLFSPSGKEVYSASGPTSVDWGGCHAYEEGTYYLALSDVKGTAGSRISVDYRHIDKYAVLEYTPKSMGVAPGGFTMKLFGNGYDQLKSAVLVSGSDEIAADSLFVYGKTDASLRFNLTGDEAYGNYDLRLTFNDGEADGELTVERAIAFVQPEYGDIDIQIHHDAKLAMPYPVTIKVKNTGNVPYLMQPVSIAYDNVDQVSDFSFENFYVLMDKEYVDAGLRPEVTTDNFMGKGIKARIFQLMIPEIGPEEEVELTVSFVAPGHTRFNLYAWADKAWSLYTKQVARNASFAKARRTVQSTDCMPDPCDVISSIVEKPEECSCALVMANIDALANLYLAMQLRANMEAIRAAGYSSYREMSEALGIHMDMFENRRLRNPNNILLRLAEHCGSEELTEVVGILQDMQDRQAQSDCPRPPHPVEVLVPGDPNDMLGYTSEAGSRYIRKDIRDVFYTIEFENDPELASASAHTVVVKDTFDARIYDLASFEPTGVKIGKVHMALNGEKSFVRTMDLRPDIDVIAEVQLEYDQTKGIATWTVRSLNPMTMEPTEDPMQGVLPINVDGNGQGELSYNIRLCKEFADGEEFRNRASIVFDRESAILTPVWTNTVDAFAPESKVVKSEPKDADTYVLHFAGTDNRSGVWKYDLFVQEGEEGAWSRCVVNIADTLHEFKGRRDADYGFCVLATDSAGNAEQKELVRELILKTCMMGDANSDGIVDILDVSLAQAKYLGQSGIFLNFEATDVNGDGMIDVMDASLIQNIYLSSSDKRSKAKRTRKKKQQQL